MLSWIRWLRENQKERFYLSNKDENKGVYLEAWLSTSELVDPLEYGSCIMAPQYHVLYLLCYYSGN